MAFCSNCGQELAEGVKFCSSCGKPIGGENMVKPIANENQRKVSFDGEIHKCPNCGEILNSFATNCPSCGYELRGVDVSDCIQRFSNAIKEIKNIEERSRYIHHFIVPNTKEDLFEFASLALSNIKNFDLDGNGKFTTEEVATVDAWVSLLEQCNNKAQKAFNDTEYNYIKKIYEEGINCYKRALKTQKSENNTEKFWLYLKKILTSKITLIVGGICVIAAIIMGIAVNFNNEKERMQNVAEQIEYYINQKDHEQASLMLSKLESGWSIINEKYEELKEEFSDEILYLKTGNRRIKMTVGYNDFLNEKYTVVKANLIALGFKEENISVDTHDQEESQAMVASISINGNKYFNKDDQFLSNSLIHIDCIRNIAIGVSEKEIVGKNYLEVKGMLETLGFTNIQFQQQELAWIDFINKEEQIVSIKIDGKSEFDAITVFQSDVEIVITYYVK